MKHKLLLILLLSPTLLFAQYQSDGISTFMGVAFGIAILVGLFYFFRSILLWYWKVDEIVKNQEETNRLLRSLVRRMESKDDPVNEVESH